METLRALFGSDLYDFSGKNEITESKGNYYESSHYRPEVGDDFLRIVYENSRRISRQLAAEMPAKSFP